MDKLANQSAMSQSADRYFAECRRYCHGLGSEQDVLRRWSALLSWCGDNSIAALSEAERAIKRFEVGGWS